MAVKLVRNDELLLARLQSGDESALSAIYKLYWSQLYVAAYNILKDQQACEDIIQELFIRLWNKRAEIQINSSLKAYLYACIRYEVYRQIRNGVVTSDVFDNLLDRLQSPPGHQTLEYKELIARISQVVDALPEKCREVYKLSREEHLSHKQIAGQLNISTKTVENQLTKALKQLRSSLGSAFLVEALVYFING